MDFLVKIRKGSGGVRIAIPKRVCEYLGIGVDDFVEVTVKKVSKDES